MKTIFEKTVSGRKCTELPESGIPAYTLKAACTRAEKADLPELSELDLVRHYDALSAKAYGVDSGFYPLGSCTMKYNPKLNECAAALEGFTDVHPLQGDKSAQGALEVLYLLTEYLKEITGMDDGTLQPAAGAHGEFTSLLMIKAYFESKGGKRTKVIVPDSAHGTNPASAAMAGFEIVNIPSLADGCVDVAALKDAMDGDVAALMLTNPNTLGLFEKNIGEIAETVHKKGGLLYYDGANLNAVMGIARPGDMGFDIMHINLHKTFATPHGGGGPGSGPVLCKKRLSEFLPGRRVAKTDGGAYALKKASPKSIGNVRAFYGNFLVCVRALTYIITLGREGIKDAAQKAVLNANYMRKRVSEFLDVPHNVPCMHEFVASCEKLKEETGVSALDVAKALIDCGIHPPTIYFPLIVHEAMMFEPTETESKETIDGAVEMLRSVIEAARTNPQELKNAPKTTPVGRPDEVKAARKPIVAFGKIPR
ncbi:MAG: aminomethyl-transferring glycine dehydrogenase subunit GcvPB [Clostridiales bacterium]|jgi:glycine dehydrogenase subunit 2|nr:aminomethyl-transferring glycine dehydrogenase subunit GcvPB [Clostridiales bacterium]